MQLEYAAILSKLEKDKEKPAQFEKHLIALQKKTGIESMINAVKKVEDWERVLRALDTLTGSTKVAAKDDKAARVVWLVDFKQGYIQPKLQTRNKKGVWSKGRNVAIKRLYTGGEDAVDSDDQKIANTIYTDQSGYYGYTEYYFNYENALKAMVGHPRLFRHDNPTVPVELTVVKPELIVEETKNSFEIKFSHPVEVHGRSIKQETPTRFNFVEVEPAHQEIAKALGKQKVIIPKTAKKPTKKFGTIILDEAQAIKNRQAKRSKAAMKLKGDFKILTTGTPIENHLGELWNLFQFLNPGLLGSHDSFQERYALPIEKNKDKTARMSLKKLIQPFILRRRKNDVLDDLPNKTEITLTVELSKEEKAFYEALRQTAIEKIEENQEEKGHAGMQILAEITRLRQACCHPKLVKSEVAIESSKLKLLEETVEELVANGHKTLIFSQFVGHLKIIEIMLQEKDITSQYLDGQTPLKKREERINAFQSGEGDVFLISLKAGGVGLNLTAADYVIHTDPWWNPAVEDQASDRAHRIGQERPVTIYRLVTENTIEEKIVALHHHKRDLADSSLEGTERSGRLSSKELLELIKER